MLRPRVLCPSGLERVPGFDDKIRVHQVYMCSWAVVLWALVCLVHAWFLCAWSMRDTHSRLLGLWVLSSL